MNQEINALVKEFANKMAELSSDDTVLVTVNINCQGYTVDFKYQDAKRLKKRGVSMRNLRGEFIE